MGTDKQKSRSNADHGDWHRVDIVAALHKAGISLRQLSLKHGYKDRTLAMVLSRPWPKGEAIVASALGTKPELIWPSRYQSDGQRKRYMVLCPHCGRDFSRRPR